MNLAQCEIFCVLNTFKRSLYHYTSRELHPKQIDNIREYSRVSKCDNRHAREISNEINSRKTDNGFIPSFT